ncbi:dihydrofolate reductase family protein [Actinomadura sp. 3N407]|uniref:dihydrofolate reductase family protein n=1 Tax=Actinomadura sp. 3N407 TaxID=3457423 RepID=UPI003FCEAAFF
MTPPERRRVARGWRRIRHEGSVPADLLIRQTPAGTVTRDPAATIRELKEQSGKDIWLWGSLKLMHSLLDAGVADEITLLVCPASRGKGTRIFEDRQDLTLAEARPFANGVVLLRYEIKK